MSFSLIFHCILQLPSLEYSNWLDCLLDKPGPTGQPQIIDSTSSSVVLKWTPPENDGGSKIDGYLVEYRAESAFQWQTATSPELTTKTTFEVKHLLEGTPYEFRVAAHNEAGMGPYTQTSAAVEASEFARE